MKLTKMAIGVIGIHTAMDGREIPFTREMLTDVSTSYSAEFSEAPVVIGHPTLTAPAYGWVKKVTLEGDTLYAHVGQVEASFAEAVNEGRYKKRSASFFLPQTPGNPKPGHYYLRHVGFLGAALPAIKGLSDVNFTECQDNTIAHIDFAFDEPVQQPTNQEIIMDKKETSEAEQKAAEEKQRQAELEAREAALKEREAKVAEAEKQKAEQEAKAQATAATEFADKMIKEGKVLPAQKQALIEVLVVASAAQPFSFSDGSQTISKSPVDIIKEIVAQKPVDFSEKSAVEEENNAVIDFADSVSVANAARQYQTEQESKGIQVSMTDAVNHIMKGAKK